MAKPLSAVLDSHGKYKIALDQEALTILSLRAGDSFPVIVGDTEVAMITVSHDQRGHYFIGCLQLQLAIAACHEQDIHQHGDDLCLQLQVHQAQQEHDNQQQQQPQQQQQQQQQPQQQHQQRQHQKQQQRAIHLSLLLGDARLPLPMDSLQLQDYINSLGKADWAVSACHAEHSAYHVLHVQGLSQLQLNSAAAKCLQLSNQTTQINLFVQNKLLCSLPYDPDTTTLSNTGQLKRALCQQLMPSKAIARLAASASQRVCLLPCNSGSDSAQTAGVALSIKQCQDADSPAVVLDIATLQSELDMESIPWMVVSGLPTGAPTKARRPLQQALSNHISGHFAMGNVAAEAVGLKPGSWNVFVQGMEGTSLCAATVHYAQRSINLKSLSLKNGLSYLRSLPDMAGSNKQAEPHTCQHTVERAATQLQSSPDAVLEFSTLSTMPQALYVGVVGSQGQQLVSGLALQYAIRLSKNSWLPSAKLGQAIERPLLSALAGAARRFTMSANNAATLGCSASMTVLLYVDGMQWTAGSSDPRLILSGHSGCCIDGVASLKLAMQSLLSQHLEKDGHFTFLRLSRMRANADQDANCVTSSSSAVEAESAPPHISMELSLVDAAGSKVEGLLTAKTIKDALAQLDTTTNDWELDQVDGSISRPLPAYLRLNKTRFSSSIKDRLPGLRTHIAAHALPKQPAVLWLYVQQQLVPRKHAFLTAAEQKGPSDMVKFSSVSIVHPAIKMLAQDIHHSDGDEMRIRLSTYQEADEQCTFGLNIDLIKDGRLVGEFTAENLAGHIIDSQKGKRARERPVVASWCKLYPQLYPAAKCPR